MSVDHPEVAARSSSTKARISNGSTLHLGKVDGRGAEARRWRDIYKELVDNLGGPEKMTLGQRILVRRATSLIVNTELVDASIAAGEPFNPDDHVRLVNVLSRTLQSLGIEMAPASEDSPGPSIHELMGQA